MKLTTIIVFIFLFLFISLSSFAYGQDSTATKNYSIEDLRTILSATVIYVSSVETDKEDYLIVVDNDNFVFKIIKDNEANLTIIPLGSFINHKRQP